MKIINEAAEKPARLWGNQQCRDVEYRMMRYVLSAEAGDVLLLYNVVTSELVALNAEERQNLKDLGLTARPGKISPALEELVHRHFLVPVDYDESRTVGLLRRLIRAAGARKGIESFTILPTTYCNARCFYCYEAGMKYMHMSEEIAVQTADYIIRNSGGSKVSLPWFGGEPTVGMNRIDQICGILKDKEIDYTSSMISNGLLLDENAAEKAVSLWNLKSVQITLDGTEDVYNRVKAYVTGHENPFETVLDNIESLLKKKIRVIIRLNLDKHNENDLKALIEQLKERYSDYADTCNVYVHVLFENEGFTPVRHSEADREDLIRREIELNTELGEFFGRESLKPLPVLITHSCMADSSESVIIGPDGHIAKCEHYLEENFGNLQSPEPDREKMRIYEERIIPDDCDNCVLFPGCIKLKVCPESSKCDRLHREFDISSYRKRMCQIYRDSLKS